MSVATVVATQIGENTGLTTIPTTVPTGIGTGDLLLAWVQVGNSALDITDDATKGWWRLTDTVFNSRETWLFARVYNSADAASTYTFTLSAGSAAAWMTVAVRGHGVTASSNIQIGSIFTRATSVGTITMPSITTVGTDNLALGFTGEATSTAADYTVTTDAGFTFVARRPNGTVIEDLTLWRKDMATAGATGSQTITYAAAALNGIGLQIAIPGGTVTAPATGQIGAHSSLLVATDKLSIGVDKIAGTQLKVLLFNSAGTTELNRVTVTNDGTSGWGNARFTGLTANTAYVVRFEVDGTVQTDAVVNVRTQPVSGSFVAVAGSCQFTGSNHPIWDRIREQNPAFLAHMGDIHYNDATDAVVWRAGMESSLTAPKFKQLLETTSMNWSPDNHDRIITNPTGAGTGLNNGETDPAGVTEWRKMAGTLDWPTTGTHGRTWVTGRVRFIQTDGWAARDDADGDPSPRTFLGAEQKQWFKDTLDAATEPIVVWLTQWTTRANANGRWNSYPEETSELEAFIDARPGLKSRMILIGGDSHSLQADSGSLSNTARMASSGFRFKGIPSLNISGFNRSDTAGDGAAEWDIANTSLRTSAQLEADFGGYSRMTFTDNGSAIVFKWEGVRVNSAGTEDVMATFTKSFATGYRFIEWDGTNETTLEVFEWDGTTAVPLSILES